jgi:hypothetical protein
MPSGAHWAQFLLRGTKSNRAAVGAQLRLSAAGKTYLRFVDGGNSFAGQSMQRVHFGLGGASKIDRLEVRWPSGGKEVFPSVMADRLNLIEEGKGVRVK